MTPPLAAAIHVWHLDLTAPAPPEEHLSPDERERAARMRSPKAHAGFVSTRGHLRRLLGVYLDRHPGMLAFASNAHGKPRLADTVENQGLVFNVSHTGEAAVLAFARDAALGVDIEAPRPHRDLRRLAATCLAAAELEWWRALPPEQRLLAFTRLWVCKEAFVKASGRGLALGLRNIAVNPGFDRYDALPGGYGAAHEWQLKEWADGDCRVALAYRGGERRIEVFRCGVDIPASGHGH